MAIAKCVYVVGMTIVAGGVKICQGGTWIALKSGLFKVPRSRRPCLIAIIKQIPRSTLR